jgi:hypothetical protein
MDIYKTEQFLECVAEFELEEHVAVLEKKISECDSYFDVGKIFDGAYPYLKHRRGKFRLIGQVKSVENRTTQVFVFYRVFERANKEYLEFLRYKGQQRGEDLVQQGHQDSHIDEWVRSKRIEVRTPNNLPIELRQWIEPLEELAVGKTRTEFHVHELDSWADSVYENFIETDEGLRGLGELVFQIIDREVQNSEIGSVEVSKLPGNSSYSVIWSKRSATEVSLLSASTIAPSQAEIDKARKTIDDEEYRSRVKRAYFSVVTYSFDLWKSIQKQDGGNIFLSEDEINSLQKMSGVDRDNALPSVLSGRAGSGKSTMLAYVFSALLLKKALHNLDGTPVYISYNSRLLRQSKDLILLLLTANGNFGEVIENSTNDVRTRLNSIMEEIDKYFFTYHEFLLSFLEEHARMNFSESKRVDFSDFKRAYSGGKSLLGPFQNVSMRTEISAERAWFIIRQFIKGALTDDVYMGQEAIEELRAAYHELHSKDQQGISFEEIATVYNKVYESWYKPSLESEQLWDDQDLVNVAHQAAATSRPNRMLITALVCDESQDFTPREIRFIVRASELLKYDLERERNLVLPYLLAGDSLQTLAPTGFRWSTVTSILYEEIFASSGVEVKPQTNQLNLNYRSVRPIVDFCNFIQLVRKDLFANIEKEIQHQTAWDNAPRARPRFFQLNQNISRSELRDLINNRILLIPCEESGEIDYIREDPFLSEIFPNVSESNPPGTVLSATAAKGLEFAHVFLYNFGSQFAKEGFEFRKSESEFGLEFFFNKLYVAASRAQHSLTIVETSSDDPKSSETGFWQKFMPPMDEPENVPQYLSQLLGDFPDFDGFVEHLELGSSGTWSDSSTRVSVVDAEKFYKNGKENRDPAQVKRAAALFKQLGGEKNINKAQECDAYYFKFTDQYELAGEAFEILGDLESAWQVYLSSGELWLKASKILGMTVDLDPSEQALVRFMSSKTDDSTALSHFLEKLTHLISGGQRITWNKPWMAAQNELTIRLRTLLELGAAGTNFSDLIRQLEVLTQRDFVVLRQFLGEVHYKLKNWSEALRVWANSSQLSDDYERHQVLAKARNRGFPEGLRELSSKNFKQEIVDIWFEHGSPKESTWLTEVIPALEKMKLYDDLLILCLNEHRMKEAMIAYRGLKDTQPQMAYDQLPFLVKACSNDFSNFAHLRLLFEDAHKNTPIILKEMCETVLTNAVKRWDDPQSHGFAHGQLQTHQQQNLLRVGFGTAERESFLQVVRLYEPSKEERQLDPRWLGLCWELAGDWENAANHYKLFSEARENRQIMEFARDGYVRNQMRLVEHHSNNGKQSLALQAQNGLNQAFLNWKYSREDKNRARSTKKIGSTVPFFVEPAKSGSFTEDGEFGPFSWQSSNKTIRLSFDETDVSLSWRVELSKREIVSNSGRLNADNDGCFRFTVAQWAVEVRHSRDELKISIADNDAAGSESKILRFKK